MRRISLRTLMALVAMAAFAMAGVMMIRRSDEFRAIAEEQADAEQASLEYADDARGERGDLQRVARGEQLAAYHRGLRLKYDRAARYPWLPAAPDPPVPDPEP